MSPLQSRDFGIRVPLTPETRHEAFWNVRAARLDAEFTRDEVLAGRTDMPHNLWRPVAALAENLAVAATRLEITGVDNVGRESRATLDDLVAKYNAALDAYVDGERLAIARDWSALTTRYGSTRRDVAPTRAPGCMSVLAAIVLTAIRLHD